MIILLMNNQTLPLMAFFAIGAMIMTSLSVSWLVLRSGERLLRAYDGLKPPVGSMLMAGFVLYVALIVSSVVRDRVLAEQSVDQEAHTLHLALSVLVGEEYPAWRQAIATYISKVTNDEWQDMQNRVRSHGAHDELQNLRSLATNGLPGISQEMRRQLLEIVNKIDSSRRDRLRVATDEVPEAVWFTLWMTA